MSAVEFTKFMTDIQEFELFAEIRRGLNATPDLPLLTTGLLPAAGLPRTSNKRLEFVRDALIRNWIRHPGNKHLNKMQAVDDLIGLTGLCQRTILKILKPPKRQSADQVSFEEMLRFATCDNIVDLLPSLCRKKRVFALKRESLPQRGHQEYCVLLLSLVFDEFTSQRHLFTELGPAKKRKAMRVEAAHPLLSERAKAIVRRISFGPD